MKYLLLGAGVLLLAVLIVAWVNRIRREEEKVRRRDYARLRERCLLAEDTLHEVTTMVATWSEVDHVMAGAITPILTAYGTKRYKMIKENLT